MNQNINNPIHIKCFRNFKFINAYVMVVVNQGVKNIIEDIMEPVWDLSEEFLNIDLKSMGYDI